jgi:hypothetical protein
MGGESSQYDYGDNYHPGTWQIPVSPIISPIPHRNQNVDIHILGTRSHHSPDGKSHVQANGVASKDTALILVARIAKAAKFCEHRESRRTYVLRSAHKDKAYGVEASGIFSGQAIYKLWRLWVYV